MQCNPPKRYCKVPIRVTNRRPLLGIINKEKVFGLASVIYIYPNRLLQLNSLNLRRSRGQVIIDIIGHEVYVTLKVCDNRFYKGF